MPGYAHYIQTVECLYIIPCCLCVCEVETSGDGFDFPWYLMSQKNVFMKLLMRIFCRLSTAVTGGSHRPAGVASKCFESERNRVRADHRSV